MSSTIFRILKSRVGKTYHKFSQMRLAWVSRFLLALFVLSACSETSVSPSEKRSLSSLGSTTERIACQPLSCSTPPAGYVYGPRPLDSNQCETGCGTLVSDPSGSAPAIVTQPQGDNVVAGTSLKLSVSASGTSPLIYKWFKRGSTQVLGSSATLTLTNISSSNAGLYYVVVSNSKGQVNSADAEVKVSSSSIAPSFFRLTSSPSSGVGNSIDLGVGASVTFSVELSEGTAPFVFEWRLNGARLVETDIPNLTLSNLQKNQAGDYSVLIRNNAGSSSSTSMRLNVNDVVTPVYFSLQPASVNVIAGSNIILNADAGGSAPITFQWQRNGVNLSNGANISGATSKSLTISQITEALAGDYRVVASNAARSLPSSVATVGVSRAPTPPSIVSGPSSITVDAGNPATFSVGANGTPPLFYQWKLNGVNISPNATSATYTVENAQNSGSYSVEVRNAQGQVLSAAATLNVRPLVIAPRISTQPTNLSLNPGGSASFSVALSAGTNPNYQWYFENSIIQGATGNLLSLSNVQASAAGRYKVRVWNSAGEEFSREALLEIATAQPNPVNSKVVERTVVDDDRGAYYTYPERAIDPRTNQLDYDFSRWHAFGTKPSGGNPIDGFYNKMEAAALDSGIPDRTWKFPHSRFQHFADYQQPINDYQAMAFKYERLEEFANLVKARKNGKSIWALGEDTRGNEGPIKFSYNFNDPGETPVMSVVRPCDDDYIQYFVNDYVRNTLYAEGSRYINDTVLHTYSLPDKQGPHWTNMGVGIDNFTLAFADRFNRYGKYQIKTNTGYSIDFTWKPIPTNNPLDPSPPNDPRNINSQETLINCYSKFFSRVKEIAPDVNFIVNGGGVEVPNETTYQTLLGDLTGGFTETFLEIEPDLWKRRAVHRHIEVNAFYGKTKKISIYQPHLPGNLPFPRAQVIRTYLAGYLVSTGPNGFFGPQETSGAQSVPYREYGPDKQRLGRPLNIEVQMKATNPNEKWISPPPDSSENSLGYRVYRRETEGGFVILNWSGTSQNIEIPAPIGHSWWRRDGTTVAPVGGKYYLYVPDLSGDYVFKADPRVERTALPQIDPRFRSKVTGNVKVRIRSLDTNAKIYYTTDGSEPTAASTLYTQPFTLSSARVVKAIATVSGKNPSFVNFATIPIVNETVVAKFHKAPEKPSPGETLFSFFKAAYPLVSLSHEAAAEVVVQYGPCSSSPTAIVPPTGTLNFRPGEVHKYMEIPTASIRGTTDICLRNISSSADVPVQIDSTQARFRLTITN